MGPLTGFPAFWVPLLLVDALRDVHRSLEALEPERLTFVPDRTYEICSAGCLYPNAADGYALAVFTDAARVERRQNAGASRVR